MQECGATYPVVLVYVYHTVYVCIYLLCIIHYIIVCQCVCIYYIVYLCVIVCVLYIVYMCSVLLLYVCMCITVLLCVCVLALVCYTHRLTLWCRYAVHCVLGEQAVLLLRLCVVQWCALLSSHCTLALCMRHTVKCLCVLSLCM